MRYYGVDLHKKYATISVRDEGGTEESFVRTQVDIKEGDSTGQLQISTRLRGRRLDTHIFRHHEC